MNLPTSKFSYAKLKKAELWVGLVVILFLGGMALAVSLAGWQESWESLSRISWQTLVLAALVCLLSYGCGAWRWEFLSHRMGITHIPTRRMWLLFGAGLALLPTPGKAGTAMRCWLMHKQFDVPYKQSMPVMIISTLHELFSALFLICLLWAYLDGNGLVIGGLLLFGIGIFMLLQPAFSLRFMALLDQLTGGRTHRVTDYARHLLQNTHKLLHWRAFIPSFISACMAWFLAALGVWLITRGIGLDVSYMLALAAFVFAMVVGMLSFLPGGIGTTEAIMAGTLLASTATTPAEATVVVLLVRLASLWVPVLFGFMLWPLAFKGLFKKAAVVDE